MVSLSVSPCMSPHLLAPAIKARADTRHPDVTTSPGRALKSPGTRVRRDVGDGQDRASDGRLPGDRVRDLTDNTRAGDTSEARSSPRVSVRPDLARVNSCLDSIIIGFKCDANAPNKKIRTQFRRAWTSGGLGITCIIMYLFIHYTSHNPGNTKLNENVFRQDLQKQK